jgi:hypothetical protein
MGEWRFGWISMEGGGGVPSYARRGRMDGCLRGCLSVCEKLPEKFLPMSSDVGLPALIVSLKSVCCCCCSVCVCPVFVVQSECDRGTFPPQLRPPPLLRLASSMGKTLLSTSASWTYCRLTIWCAPAGCIASRSASIEYLTKKSVDTGIWNIKYK